MEKDNKVRAKKFLGQHFLRDENIARKIVEALKVDGNPVVEVGPGMGVLTKYLITNQDIDFRVIEIDRESVAYLRVHYPNLTVIEGDFLEIDLKSIFTGSYKIIGNFPYNISSQIFFKVLENRDQITEVVGMIQKEVADRIAAKHGNKTYGILSVLLQAFYDIQLCFKVNPGVFNPPPKVMSAVIRLVRNNRSALPCSEQLFFTVVKQGFNNRRKTLRNALKNLNLIADVSALPVMDKRAEQLSVQDFIELTCLIEESRAGTRS